MEKPKILFFSGASGAGKTELLKSLEKSLNNKKNIIYLHFDSIGVPSEEEMIKKYDSGENWQKEMTLKWVDKILSEYKNEELILFEGQVNLLFIKQAFVKHDFSNYKIILVHCKKEQRHLRLINSRNQPELVNEQMDNWANFLYNQAKEDKNIYLLDTTNKNLEELVLICKSEFEL